MFFLPSSFPRPVSVWPCSHWVLGSHLLPRFLIIIFSQSRCLHEAEPTASWTAVSSLREFSPLGLVRSCFSQALTQPVLVSSSFPQKATRMPLKAGSYLCLSCPFPQSLPIFYSVVKKPSSVITFENPFLSHHSKSPPHLRQDWCFFVLRLHTILFIFLGSRGPHLSMFNVQRVASAWHRVSTKHMNKYGKWMCSWVDG